MDIDNLYNFEIHNITIKLEDGTIISDEDGKAKDDIIKRIMVCTYLLAGIETDLLLLLDGITKPEDRRAELEKIITKIAKSALKKEE